MNGRTVTVLAILAVGACNGDETCEEATAKEITADTNERVPVMCEAAHRCNATYPDGSFLTFADVFGASPTTCESQLKVLEDQVSSTASGVCEGRVEYFPERGAACDERMLTIPCEEFWVFPAHSLIPQFAAGYEDVCRIYEGAGQIGDPCVSSAECESQVCDLDDRCAPLEEL